MAQARNTITAIKAPELQTSRWLNAPQPLTLASLRGKVVVLHTFQIFCPGCVQVGIPQAQKIHQEFDPDRVAVIGLHTVFEHHSVMGPDALEVFAYEYRLRFPIGIDKYEGEPQGVPMTMRAYQMQGTPTLVLIDKNGYIRLHKFGHISDLTVGFSIGALLSEESEEPSRSTESSATAASGAAIDSGVTDTSATDTSATCDTEGCNVK
jgi:thiol-disulfide isomerase/thioredoxin